jgi:hypothetical protein
MQGLSHRRERSRDRRIGNIGLRQVGRGFIYRRIHSCLGLLEDLSYSAPKPASESADLKQRVRHAVLARMRSTRGYGERLLETEARVGVLGRCRHEQGRGWLVQCESNHLSRSPALLG